MHLQLSSIAILLLLMITARAEKAVILGKEFEYGTVSELHMYVLTLLKTLDNEIVEKRNAENIILNPFRDKAKTRRVELEKQRRDLLDAHWTCPYWKRCDRCDGGNRWYVGGGWFGTGACLKCGNKNGFFYHEEHRWPDEKFSCPPSKGSGAINTLLGSPPPP
jgi:hypothetical protein